MKELPKNFGHYSQPKKVYGKDTDNFTSTLKKTKQDKIKNQTIIPLNITNEKSTIQLERKDPIWGEPVQILMK